MMIWVFISRVALMTIREVMLIYRTVHVVKEAIQFGLQTLCDPLGRLLRLLS